MSFLKRLYILIFLLSFPIIAVAAQCSVCGNQLVFIPNFGWGCSNSNCHNHYARHNSQPRTSFLGGRPQQEFSFEMVGCKFSYSGPAIFGVSGPSITPMQLMSSVLSQCPVSAPVLAPPPEPDASSFFPAPAASSFFPAPAASSFFPAPSLFPASSPLASQALVRRSGQNNLELLLIKLLALYYIFPKSIEQNDSGFELLKGFDMLWKKTRQGKRSSLDSIRDFCQCSDLTLLWPEQGSEVEDLSFHNPIDITMNQLLSNYEVVTILFYDNNPLFILHLNIARASETAIPLVSFHGMSLNSAYSSNLSSDAVRNLLTGIMKYGVVHKQSLSTLIFVRRSASIEGFRHLQIKN